MTSLSPLLARLVLRYVGLITLGASGASLASDPDLVALVAALIGAAMSAAAEAWMIHERRAKP
jgi:hypothetical protein